MRIDYLLADTSFDQPLIKRRVRAQVAPGVVAWVCTAEDLLILKLISTRPRDYEDAAGLAARQKGKLDTVYIREWLDQFQSALDDSTLLLTFERLI